MPATHEGWQVWDLVQRLGGQFRLAGGGLGPGVFMGWDMTAALALGAALGIDQMIIAEILPDIEAVAMRELNKKQES